MQLYLADWIARRRWRAVDRITCKNEAKYVDPYLLQTMNMQWNFTLKQTLMLSLHTVFQVTHCSEFCTPAVSLVL